MEKYSNGKWLNKLWYIYIIEYYPVFKKNKLLIHATTCKEITLHEMSQFQKDTYYMILPL